MTTKAKPGVLGAAFAGLNRPAAKATDEMTAEPKVQATTPSSSSDDRPIGVMFRLTPRDHEIVSDYARDMRMSVQELLENAVNRMRKADGLSEIQGRPRSKTRRK
mgnify:CR=1 FL=1|jgi:hypothetical protein